jgi:hypothetical protein
MQFIHRVGHVNKTSFFPRSTFPERRKSLRSNDAVAPDKHWIPSFEGKAGQDPSLLDSSGARNA